MASERERELRRRRKRQQKFNVYARRAANAQPAEKAVLAEKLRKLTPGAQVKIEQLGLADQ